MEVQNRGYDEFRNITQQNDLKQHADKIIRGIKEIGSSHARRAIWELFQNAVDLSERCEILIEVNDYELVFSHNGKPFTMCTLDCLFTQVSSKTLTEKKRERENEDQTGQYGTGFMTSHSFGDVVRVSGAIQEPEDSELHDSHFEFQDLVIDRSTQNWKQMCGEIARLRDSVGGILRQEPAHGELPPTTFRFRFSSDLNKERAIDAIRSLDMILPCVMIFNDRLKKVVVRDAAGNETLYEKEAEKRDNGSYFSRWILINDKAKSLNYLRIDEAIVILPLQAASEGDGRRLIADPYPDALPRLFLFYPLIGTEGFGFNFVVHSKNFHPTEPRDGLHLQSDNPKNEMEEQANRAIMDKVSEAIFEFLRTNLPKIENPHLLAEINFAVSHEDKGLEDYFEGLKKKWTNEFMELPLVETSLGRISSQKAVFFEPSVLSEVDRMTLRAIHNIASEYYPGLPSLPLVAEWSKIIGEWGVDVKWVGFSDIADEIEKRGTIAAFDKGKLKLLYEAMIVKGKKEIFMDNALLPNIKGQLKKQGELCQAIYLPDELTPLADAINPEISDCQVDPDFIFEGLEFGTFGRKEFREKINAALDRGIIEDARLCDLSTDYVAALVRYSCIIPREDSMNSGPLRIIKLIAEHENIPFSPIVVPSLSGEDGFDVRKGRDCFFKAYLNDVRHRDELWVKENINALSRILIEAFNNVDISKIFKQSDVFPDQMFKLKSIDKLSREEEEIPNFIKDMYDDVVKPAQPVRETLAHSSIAEIPQNSKTVLDLTRDIERQFFGESGDKISMANHEFKKQILDVIQKTKSDNAYEKFFPDTMRNRTSILAQSADGEDMFKILSQGEATIKRLASIAGRPDLDELIWRGDQAIETAKRKDAEMERKSFLGTHLESVLGQYLSLKVRESVANEQNGQDLIIYDGEKPVYYIEVKSKWQADTPFRLSRNQTLQAYDNPKRYALCTIDMTKYTGADKYEVKSILDVVYCMKFNIDVGTRVKHLVDIYKDDRSHTDDFRLDGDYRTYIPYEYIRSEGIDLHAFEKMLLSFLGSNEEG